MTSRLDRLLVLVPVARARPGISLDELARTLACGPGELRSDIELLACVGSPPFQPDDLIDIELRDDRVWVHLPQAFDRPTRLTATEAAALTIAARSLAPNDALARSAVDKLQRAIQPAQRGWYEGLVSQLAAPPADVLPDVEKTIAEAIRSRREISIDYHAPGQPLGPRVVHPRVIASANAFRYLSARKPDGQERLYRLDRIRGAGLGEKTFDPLPPIDLAAELARVAHWGDRPDLPKATLRFDSSVAAAVAVRHPGAVLGPDGSLRAEVAYSTLPWLISYALSWSGRALVVAPADAREAFARAVDDALRLVEAA